MYNPERDINNPAYIPAEDTSNEPYYETATMAVRLLNYILDNMFIVVVLVMVLALFPTLIPKIDETTLTLAPEDQIRVNILVFVVSFMYYSGLEGIRGRTLGKIITGTMVVDEHGESPGNGRILIRTLCRFIPFEAFIALFRDGSGLHDSLSKTRVVYSRKRIDVQ